MHWSPIWPKVCISVLYFPTTVKVRHATVDRDSLACQTFLLNGKGNDETVLLLDVPICFHSPDSIPMRCSDHRKTQDWSCLFVTTSNHSYISGMNFLVQGRYLRKGDSLPLGPVYQDPKVGLKVVDSQWKQMMFTKSTCKTQIAVPHNRS